MSNYIANESGTSYGGVLSVVIDSKQVRTIETQFLNGSFNVQTIGTHPRRLAVDYYGSHATRLLLEALADEAGVILVYWKSRIYTGTVSSAIQWSRHSRDRADLAERMQFQVLVSAEADQ